MHNTQVAVSGKESGGLGRGKNAAACHERTLSVIIN